jgi:hypothetical protein
LGCYNLDGLGWVYQVQVSMREFYFTFLNLLIFHLTRAD